MSQGWEGGLAPAWIEWRSSSGGKPASLPVRFSDLSFGYIDVPPRLPIICEYLCKSVAESSEKLEM